VPNLRNIRRDIVRGMSGSIRRDLNPLLSAEKRGYPCESAILFKIEVLAPDLPMSGS